MKFRFRKARAITPLSVRETIGRLRQTPHPARYFIRLIWPFPWHFKPSKPFRTVDELQTHGEELTNITHAGLDQLRWIPLFRRRDTSLCSLYRLYEALCADDLIPMGYETEYFYFHPEPSWALSSIPDPRDDDPVRYAVLASLVEALADAFNWRLGLGLRRDHSIVEYEGEEGQAPFEPETVPAWVHKVPRLEHPLRLGNVKEGLPVSAGAQAFLKRNIETEVGYLYTI